MTPTTVFGYFVLPALAFGLVYFPITRVVRSAAVAYPKADVKRRFLAAGVDSFLILGPWLYYVKTRSAWFLLVGAGYLLLRDSMAGRSPGKFLCGLVVIDLGTGEPAGIAASARRNFMLVIPGANLMAVILETATVIRDPQGQRLGDRFALTQVVDGFGIRDLAESFVRSWSESMDSVVGEGAPQPDRELSKPGLRVAAVGCWSAGR